MTFREKLADWISGGKLSAANISATQLLKSYDALADKNERLIDLSQERREEALKLRSALYQIEMQQTKYSNATVTRMARIAREALLE